MADVLPFAGTRFNLKDPKQNPGALLAPPPDVITPEVRKHLYEQHEHNLVRLVSGMDQPSDDDHSNRYTRAAETYRDWKNRQVLSDEIRKCFYVYEQEFKPSGGRKPIKRRGFIALVKLQDYRSGKIRASEMPLRSVRQDQLRLLKACQVNLIPPVMLYQDAENAIGKMIDESVDSKGKDANAPIVDCKDAAGVHHRLWLVHKKEPILHIHEAMKDKRLYIADGANTYDAALAYRDEMREATGRRDGRQPYDHLMMYMHNAADEKLQVLPIHRVLARELGADVDIEEVLEDVREYFTAKEFKVDMSNLSKAAALVEEKLAAVADDGRARMAMVLPTGRSFALHLRKETAVGDMIEEETMSDTLKAFDVSLLHHYLITRGWIGNPEVELGEDDIFYVKQAEEALDLLKKRRGSVAFILAQHKLSSVLDIAENGELLPALSTFFTPKVPCGLVMRDHTVGFG